MAPWNPAPPPEPPIMPTAGVPCAPLPPSPLEKIKPSKPETENTQHQPSNALPEGKEDTPNNASIPRGQNGGNNMVQSQVF